MSDNEQFDGVLGVSMDPASQVIQIEHQDTGKTFEFHRDELDEVVATLRDFQAALKAGEVAK